MGNRTVRRGEIYRVFKPRGDPKQYRCFVLASRQELIDSRFSTIICAPIFTEGQGLTTEVAVGVSEGLKHNSWIFCDNLCPVTRPSLTQFIGSLSAAKLDEFDAALAIALGLS